MKSFKCFELSTEYGFYYSVKELDDVLNKSKDNYAFKTVNPIVKIYLEDEDGMFLADQCEAKNIKEKIKHISRIYDVAIPAKRILNNSSNVLKNSKTGERVIYSPLTKKYSLESNPHILVTKSAVLELEQLGFLRQTGTGKYVVLKSQ